MDQSEARNRKISTKPLYSATTTKVPYPSGESKIRNRFRNWNFDWLGFSRVLQTGIYAPPGSGPDTVRSLDFKISDRTVPGLTKKDLASSGTWIPACKALDLNSTWFTAPPSSGLPFRVGSSHFSTRDWVTLNYTLSISAGCRLLTKCSNHGIPPIHRRWTDAKHSGWDKS